MLGFSSGPTTAEDWKTDATGSAEGKYGSSRKCMTCTSKNIDVIEELVLSQEDVPASEIHRTMHHIWAQNDIIVNLTFPYWKPVFWYQLLITNISETVQWIVLICNIYVNQLIYKVAVSMVINSDKLSCSDDELYFGITFGTKGIFKTLYFNWFVKHSGTTEHKTWLKLNTRHCEGHT